MQNGNKSIAQAFMLLPGSVRYEGAFFKLCIAPGNRDLRLGYTLESVSQDNPRYPLFEECGGWANPFDRDKLQGFLFLREGIENDDDLLAAIGAAHEFITKNGLI